MNGGGDGVRTETASRRRIERPYRVRFEEVTADRTIRSALLLAYAQDCAWQHSAWLGYDRAWYDERAIFWLVRAVELDILAPVATYEDLVVSTEVVGFRRATARRVTEVRDATGRVAARAEIDWLLVNERGVPTRIPAEFDRIFDAEGAAGFEIHRVTLPSRDDDVRVRQFDVRRRDLDQLDHVNNSVYVDYLEEALEAAGAGRLLGQTPRRYVLEYAGAAERGARLTDRTWRAGGRWWYAIERADGSEIFRATAAPL